jgi:hypothetical protein
MRLTAFCTSASEAAPQVGHQFAHLFVRQIGRGAAAKVQLLDQLRILADAGEQAALHLDFALQVGQVSSGLLAVFGDDLVAGAVVADRVAERDVDVQRERARVAAGAAVGHRMQVVAVAEAVREAVGGRVGGIARAGLAEAGDQAGIEVDGGLRLENQWNGRDGCGLHHEETPCGAADGQRKLCKESIDLNQQNL